MSSKNWVLTSVADDVYLPELSIGPGDVPGSSGTFSVQKRTLRGGLRDGVDVVEVDNGRLRFTTVPSRGMGLWRAWLGNLEVGWQSPVRGPVHPRHVPLDEASGIGWLSGFDELLCRCGLESNGAPEFDDQGQLRYSLHGRIANIPAHQVEVDVDPAAREIRVSGTVDEARIFGSKLRLESTVATTLGEPALRITDRVTNLSAQPGGMELLYHINLGAPLCVPGSRVHAPVATLAPRNEHAAAHLDEWNRYGPHATHAPESVYFLELATDDDGRTQVLLEAPGGGQGLIVAFNRRQFPFFTLWKNPLEPADGYVTGLEPCINFPNPRSFEEQQGRVAKLQPEESRTFELELRVLGSSDEVSAARGHIEQLAGGVKPQVFQTPRAEWSV